MSEKMQYIPRTKGIYYPDLSLKVFIRTVPTKTVDNRVVVNLPVCYTWRRHNAIVIVWPPTYNQPNWRVKCCDGETSTSVGLISGNSTLEEALNTAEAMMWHMRIGYKSSHANYNLWDQSRKISAFMASILDRYSDGAVLTALHGD